MCAGLLIGGTRILAVWQDVWGGMFYAVIFTKNSII